MNQTQRNFLIEKIKERNKNEKKVLQDSLPERPNLEAFLLNEVMSDRFKIIDNDAIRQMIIDKTLTLKKDKKLLGSKNSWHQSRDEICFDAEKFFILPKRYQELLDEYERKYKEIWDRLGEIGQLEEMLILRIQLASPKKLEKLVSEVDDFGDLSLFDTKLKALGQ